MATRKQPLLGSHARSWIWGRNVVLESLRAGHWLPYELRLAEATTASTTDSPAAEATAELTALADQRAVVWSQEPTARLTQLCGSADHQGVIALMPPFPYADAAALLETAAPRDTNGPTALFIITDHLQDPHNFGAILRSLDAFGGTGVFIPDSHQVGVTSQVARSSAGAVNHLPIARVPDLLPLIQQLRSRGIRVVAASEHAATPLHEADLSGPLAIVIGNEGVGIAPELQAACDLTVAVPLTGHIGSLNAAVAAGVILYEAARRRRVA